MDLNLNAMPQVLVGMSAGNTYRLGDQRIQISGVALGAERQSGQDATTYVDVLIRDELPKGGLAPCRAQVG